MYLSKERKEAVAESGANIKTFDELVYAVSVFILKMWNDAPNDNTINVLTKELIVDPKHSQFVNNLRQFLAHSLSVADIYTACRVAYDEFFQRVVRLHRALQCRENGDLEGYKLALKPLLDKLGQEVMKDQAASTLIIPGKK